MRASRLILLALTLSFFAFAACYVPRLTNPLWTDAQFTGWVAPFAHRLLEGQRLYRDFTLPISPGSFVVLAAIQKLSGRYLLIDEIWVCTLCNFAMAALAYVVAATFTTRFNAALISVVMAVWLIGENKQIAYDYLTLSVAWAMVALFVRASTLPYGRRRSWRMASAGCAATLAVGFKSSGGAGACLGLAFGVGAIAVIAALREGREGARRSLADVRAAVAGALLGVVLDAGLVWLVGGTLGEAATTVLIDGPRLKAVDQRFFDYFVVGVFQHTSLGVTIFASLLISWVLVRAARSGELFRIGSAPIDDDAFERGRRGLLLGVGVALLIALVFGAASVALVQHLPPPGWVFQAAAQGQIVIAAAFIVLHLHLFGNASASTGALDRRTSFVAAFAACWCVEALQGMSAPPFMGGASERGMLLPLGLVALITELDRVRAHGIKLVALAALSMQLFGLKYLRHWNARIPVEDRGFWAGLYVSSVGARVVTAAQRARELAGPHGTVLAIPEDPMLEALIGRPRPKLRGGAVFVDQYPEHVLAEDTRALLANPPDVLLLNPSDDLGTIFYRLWSDHSPAERLQTAFYAAHKDSYDFDSEYEIICGPQWKPLKVFVKKRELRANAE